MDTESLICQLKNSNLYAECPKCYQEFKLTESILFDGTKSFPEKAAEIQQSLIQALREREEDLKKRQKLVTKKTVITTKAVNIGKNLEKILPTMKDFRWELPDSRFLGDPIDLIVFNGFSKGEIESLSFIEVKSGKAKLNSRQKTIKEAIENNRVSCKVLV